MNVPAPLAERITSSVGALAAISGDESTARRLLAQSVLAVQRNPKLLKADPESFILAVNQVGQWGLDIGMTAHLVPFYSKSAGKTLVTAIADYKGMIALAVAAKAARSIEARVVYAGEAFAVRYGTNAGIEHVPDFGKQGSAANITHAYAIARHGFSTPPTFVVLSRAEIEARRAVSHNKDGDTWRKNYPAMAKKSAVRALAPMLPQTPRLVALMSAFESDVPGEAPPPAPAIAEGEFELEIPRASERSGEALAALEAAMRVVLPGSARSFSGHGGKVLNDVPTLALNGALGWAQRELDKPEPHASAELVANAAALVLAAREAGELTEPTEVAHAS